ncbi:4-(cytidine 5'-diphospho)-2-C-methyl-D-erythritol kinase [Thiovibrio sp. JS02]
MPLTCEAPAKINLYLAIKGKRADGYHELVTQMLKLTLADLLHFEIVSGGITLICPDSDLPTGDDNLVFRAAMTFLAAADLRQGVRIVLEKKVPIAAGLGGGSSDAAAVLRGLNQLFHHPFSPERLLDLARPLGADVPFFVHDCAAAWATGIGDVITPNQISAPDWVVLVNPGFSVSTKWVYENFTLTTVGNPYILGREFARGVSPCPEPENVPLYNDLEAVTIRKYPELGLIKEELLADGAHGALMSGSGPTVFGLFREKEHAQASAAKFLKRFGSNVFVTRPLGTRETLRRWGVVKR